MAAAPSRTAALVGEGGARLQPSFAPPRRKTAAAAVSRAAKEECERETLVLERDAPRVRLLLDSQTGQLVNSGQLVKVSSQILVNFVKMLK